MPVYLSTHPLLLLLHLDPSFFCVFSITMRETDRRACTSERDTPSNLLELWYSTRTELPLCLCHMCVLYLASHALGIPLSIYQTSLDRYI